MNYESTPGTAAQATGILQILASSSLAKENPLGRGIHPTGNTLDHPTKDS